MSVPTCSHRKADGILCGSPALRGQNLCYWNHRDLRREHHVAQLRRRTETLLVHLLPLETPQDLQLALFDVLDALAANRIDPARASAVLFGLQQVASHRRDSQAA